MSDNQIRSRACWLKDGGLIKGSAEEFFPFFNGKKHVISLVGGGGKSTLMEYLAQRFAARGMKTAIMTTTRIARPEKTACSMEECRACWAGGEYAACGEAMENGKFRAPQQEMIDWLLEEADVIIVEADGAHMLACKAPAEHEPVILPQSDIVIGVMGIEVIGGAVGKVCHRPQYVCALLGCGMDHCLTAEDMADILLSEQGTRKNVGARDFYAVLNKCDDEQRMQDGMRVVDALKRRGHERAMLNSFKK